MSCRNFVFTYPQSTPINQNVIISNDFLHNQLIIEL